MPYSSMSQGKMHIAFYKGRKRLLNRLTAWWLKGPYSHCELVLDTNESDVSTCASSSLDDGGVRIKRMRLDPALWDLVPVTGDLALVNAWLCENLGKSYDYRGFAGFAARFLGHNKDSWLCSEAVADMLGLPDSWRFDPCSLWAAFAPRHTQTPAPAKAGFFTSNEG